MKNVTTVNCSRSARASQGLKFEQWELLIDNLHKLHEKKIELICTE